MLWRSPPTVRRPAGFIAPCLPTLARVVPDGPQWVHEIKHDGFRFIVRCDGDRVRAFTRRGHDWTDRVPSIAEAMLRLRVRSVTLDGEAVCCDGRGVTDFDRLRSAMARLGSPDVVLFAFDLLELDGEDLRPHPWDTRRATLAGLLRKVGPGIRLSEHLEGMDGTTVFAHACQMGLEGIVAKRRDRPYRSGRCPDWIKVKNPQAPAASRHLEYWK